MLAFGNLYEIFGISLTFAIYVHRSLSLALSFSPSLPALNEIVIKCFNIEVTKGPATAGLIARVGTPTGTGTEDCGLWRRWRTSSAQNN